MGFLLGLFTGLAALWFFHRCRTAELRCALNAALEQGEIASRRERELAAALLAVKGRAEKMRRIVKLGEPVALAPGAENGHRPANTTLLIGLSFIFH